MKKGLKPLFCIILNIIISFINLHPACPHYPYPQLESKAGSYHTYKEQLQLRLYIF